MSKKSLEVGNVVVVGAAGSVKRGVVAFIGETQFAAGEWVGVVLNTAEGKNDGSVGGVRYFECEPNFGLFVKRAQVKLDRTDAGRSATAQDKLDRTDAGLSATAQDKLVRIDLGLSATAQESAQSHSDRLAALRKRRQSALPEMAAVTISTGQSVAPSEERAQSPLGAAEGAEQATSVTRAAMTGSEEFSSAAPVPIHDVSDGMRASSDGVLFPSADPATRAQTVEMELELQKVKVENDRMRSEASLREAMITELRSDADQKIAELRRRLTDTEAAMCSKDDLMAEQGSAHMRVVSKLEEKVLALTTESSELRHKLMLQARAGENTSVAQSTQLALEKALGDSRERVQSLEQQLMETLDTMEVVTLDKEQLALEFEELEERFNALQQSIVDRSASTDDPSAVAPVDSSSLAAQNEKLKEALRRLQAVSTAETKKHQEMLHEALATAAKNALAAQSLLQEEKDGQIARLQEELRKMALEINELSQMVDAASEAEAMVEKLTAENLHLTQANEELKGVVYDLEEAAEIMEELDASQRSEIISLRREAEDKDAEMSKCLSEVNGLRTKLEDVSKVAERLQKQLEGYKEKCAVFQADIDARMEQSLGLVERQREAKYKLAQRRLLWYNDQCENLTLSVARLETSIRGLTSRHARVISMLPSADVTGIDTNELVAMIKSELKRLDNDIHLAEALDSLFSVNNQIMAVLNPSFELRLENDTLAPTMRDVSYNSIAKIIFNDTRILILNGMALCWKSIVLVNRSPGEPWSSARAVQSEDSILALQAALIALKEAVSSHIHPCFKSAVGIGTCLDDRSLEPESCTAEAPRSVGCDVLDSFLQLSKIISTHSILEALLDKCQDRLCSCLSSLQPAQEIVTTLEDIDAVFKFERLRLVSSGLAMCSALEGVCATPGDKPAPSAEWYTSAINNILSRLQNCRSSATVESYKADEVNSALEIAAKSFHQICIDLVKERVTISKTKDEISTTSEDFAGRPALDAIALVYSSLQDASSSISSIGESGQEIRSTLNISVLLKRDALWDECGNLSHSGRSLNLHSWVSRVAEIKKTLSDLAESQKKLKGAVSRADDLQRENSSLSVELRACRSRMAELLSVQDASSADAVFQAELSDLKQENAILSEALLVLENQLVEHRMSQKLKISVADRSAMNPTVDKSDCVKMAAMTERGIGLLKLQLRTWRGLACKRLLESPSCIRAGGIVPLISVNCNKMHDVMPKAIYRDARRNRSKIRVIPINQGKATAAQNYTTATALALRFSREQRLSESLARSMRDALALFIDNTSTLNAQRKQQ